MYEDFLTPLSEKGWENERLYISILPTFSNNSSCCLRIFEVMDGGVCSGRSYDAL